jgi:hypothetical protein
MAVIVILVGVVLTLLGLLTVLALGIAGFAIGGSVGAAVGTAIGGVILVMGLITLAAGLGLWRMRGWAWWLTVIVLILDLVFTSSLVFAAFFLILIFYLAMVKKHFTT